MVRMRIVFFTIVLINTILFYTKVKPFSFAINMDIVPHTEIRNEHITELFELINKNSTTNQKTTELYAAKLVDAIQQIENKEIKHKLFKKLGKLYVDNQYFLEEAIVLYTNAAKYHMVKGELYELGICNGMLGSIYFLLDRYEQSQLFFKKSFHHFQDNSVNEITAEIYRNYVSLLVALGDDEEVFEYCIELLDYYEKRNDTESVFDIKLKIGEIYFANRQYNKAVNFNRALLKEYEHQKVDKINAKKRNIHLWRLHTNLGHVYRVESKLDSSLFWFKKGLNFVDNQDLQKYIPGTYNSIGKVYLLKHEYRNALGYLEAALDFENKGVPFVFANSRLYGNLSTCYAGLGDKKNALFYLDKTLKYADSSSSLLIKKNSRTHAYKVNKLLKKYATSNFYFVERGKYEDSIRDVRASGKIAKLESKYRQQQKQREIDILLKDNEIELLTISREKIANSFLIFLVLAFISFSTYFLYRFWQNKKLTEELTKRNIIINRQRDEISLSLKNQNALNQELNEINGALQKFFSIISHDLKAPFNVILGFCDLLFCSIDELDKKDVKKYIAWIRTSAYKNFHLTEKLLSWAATNQRGITVSRKITGIKEIVDKVIDNYEDLIVQKKIKIQANIKESFKANVDPNILETVLSNLVNNAIKFTRIGGYVEVHAKSVNNMICIEVKDNGIGMNADEVENLLKIDKVHSKKGTNDECGSGLGLILCKELLTYHNGYLEVKSEEGIGTSFSVFIIDK
ncbi:tetratricopeptide repeat-containing sensor histidine kinase [Aquimarina sp. 2201CG14-23]|uniref:tetratricopeptide repeat-containing sensor histidine kinase n=1 Tax=Aquimarina mycalae TaxID=3040073 RepID=UPI002477F849|nr:ATP-binding protein [Aquimarina sp. 2201CG14-23]MDH7445855.1 ATP-binding protein [Aquimarina sp. 2201CG14-23]